MGKRKKEKIIKALDEIPFDNMHLIYSLLLRKRRVREFCDCPLCDVIRMVHSK